MSNDIFRSDADVGNATVTVIYTANGRQERHSSVHRVSIVGQTLLVSNIGDNGSYWTSTYPEASVCIDISATIT